MILHLGERVACEECIRGHRAADCSHLNKYLIEIKGRGRPGAKDPFLRFRIDPNPPVVRESMEQVENKNGRSKSGSTKRCFHLADRVKGRIYKVDLSNSFKVLGPATQEEMAGIGSKGTFRVNQDKRYNPKNPRRRSTADKNNLSKDSTRRSSTESIESNNSISRNSSVFSLNANLSSLAVNGLSNPIVQQQSSSSSASETPQNTASANFETSRESADARKRPFPHIQEEDFKNFAQHSFALQQPILELSESFVFPTSVDGTVATPLQQTQINLNQNYNLAISDEQISEVMNLYSHQMSATSPVLNYNNPVNSHPESQSQNYPIYTGIKRVRTISSHEGPSDSPKKNASSSLSNGFPQNIVPSSPVSKTEPSEVPVTQEHEYNVDLAVERPCVYYPNDAGLNINDIENHDDNCVSQEVDVPVGLFCDPGITWN
jgi:hypothetical protein